MFELYVHLLTLGSQDENGEKGLWIIFVLTELRVTFTCEQTGTGIRVYESKMERSESLSLKRQK